MCWGGSDVQLWLQRGSTGVTIGLEAGRGFIFQENLGINMTLIMVRSCQTFRHTPPVNPSHPISACKCSWQAIFSIDVLCDLKKEKENSFYDLMDLFLGIPLLSPSY